MLCITCDTPIKPGIDGARQIKLHPGARAELTGIVPNAKFDALLEDYGVCGNCPFGPALFEMLNRAAKIGN